MIEINQVEEVIEIDERLKFLETTVVNRLESLTELANACGTPWYAKLEVSEVDGNWHRSY